MIFPSSLSSTRSLPRSHADTTQHQSQAGRVALSHSSIPPSLLRRSFLIPPSSNFLPTLPFRTSRTYLTIPPRKMVARKNAALSLSLIPAFSHPSFLLFSHPTPPSSPALHSLHPHSPPLLPSLLPNSPALLPVSHPIPPSFISSSLRPLRTSRTYLTVPPEEVVTRQDAALSLFFDPAFSHLAIPLPSLLLPYPFLIPCPFSPSSTVPCPPFFPSLNFPHHPPFLPFSHSTPPSFLPFSHTPPTPLTYLSHSSAWGGRYQAGRGVP